MKCRSSRVALQIGILLFRRNHFRLFYGIRTKNSALFCGRAHATFFHYVPHSECRILTFRYETTRATAMCFPSCTPMCLPRLRNFLTSLWLRTCIHRRMQITRCNCAGNCVSCKRTVVFFPTTFPRNKQLKKSNCEGVRESKWTIRKFRKV